MRSFAIVLTLTAFGSLSAKPIASDYSSLQEAIDKNPGQVVEVPSGNYEISAPLRITKDNAGLVGSGRIVQINPNAAILVIEKAANVLIRGITLTRPVGEGENKGFGLQAVKCDDLYVDNVTVAENRSRIAAFQFEGGQRLKMIDCTALDYMCISVDDRTESPDWGYAFQVIDGTGINLTRGIKGALLQGNHVVERNFIPTPEIKAQYKLGQFTKKNPTKGTLTAQSTWDEGYANNWHQGSAICLADPEEGDYIQLLGNYIENAAQGIDCHADHVIIAQNIINNAFMGMKAMHGSRNVLILANQFSRNDLWSIGLMPGASSHATGQPARSGQDPAKAHENVDAGSIVANNIVSDFGFGTANWMWEKASRSPFLFDGGQKDFNPPLTDVIVDGNILYDTGADKVLENGQPVLVPPRYVTAVNIGQQPSGPRNVLFFNNIFAPGTKGVSNVPLPPQPTNSPSDAGTPSKP